MAARRVWRGTREARALSSLHDVKASVGHDAQSKRANAHKASAQEGVKISLSPKINTFLPAL